MKPASYPSVAEFQSMTADDFAAFWHAFEKLEMIKSAPFAGRWYLGRHDISDIITLKRAGWKPEPQTVMSEPMSWFWRRPKRSGSRETKGKQFKSTSQAMGELRRVEASSSKAVSYWKIMVNVSGEMHPAMIPAHGPHGADLMARNLCGYVTGPASPSQPLSANQRA